MNPEDIAILGNLLDQRMGRLETTLVEKVTIAVSENVSEIVCKKVNKKIETMIVPIVQRQDQFETKTETTLAEIQKQIKVIVQNQSAQRVDQRFPSLPVRQPLVDVMNHSNPPLKEPDTSNNDPQAAAIENIISNAKCVIGIAPLTPSHVEQQQVDPGEDALIKAVVEYFRKELNVKESEISESHIEKVFLPVKTSPPDFSKVYVKFTSEEPANLCLSLAKSLTNRENKISRYFPRQFNARVGALGRTAYQLRNLEHPFKTSIEYTDNDVALFVCPRGQFSYRPYCVENLPSIDLKPIRSPPAGRKNKRRRSFSQSPPSKDTKKDRKVSPAKETDNAGSDSSDDDTIDEEDTQTENAQSAPPADEEPHTSDEKAPSAPLPHLAHLTDIGQISNFQAMSPSTGHLSFDFNRCPERRLSLNF